MKLHTPYITMVMGTIVCLIPPWISESYGSQTMREKIKSTIAGAEYVVTGVVDDVRGNMYTLHTSGGETLQLEITDDTNMFCQSQSERSQLQRTGMGQQTQTQQTEPSIGTSEKQAQSQESHSESQSKGFRIGDCPFQKGDIVKAELTDMGTVTYIRSVDSRSVDAQPFRSWQARERHEGKGSGRSTEEMGLPQEYVFLPAGALGSLNVKATDQYAVKTSDGEDVGYVYKVILNNQGDPAYVIIREKDTQQLKPLPWQAVQVSPETHTVTLVVSRSQIDQLPGYSSSDISMNKIQGFWEIAKAEKERRVSQRQARGHERFYEGPYEESFPYDDKQYTESDPRYPDYPERGARPGEAGEPGEVSIFGSPSTLPPAPYSPQYGGADRQPYQGDRFRNRGERERYDRADRAFDRDREGRFSDDFRDQRDRGRYERGDRQRSFDRDRQARYFDELRSQGDRGYSRSQERRSGMGYDDRPEPYRP